ncbi:CBASS cGAMP synthase [Collimonas sp. H4R21]|uniref:Cyclic GMP-AMP synthase n=1 Tax=Collimonas rhizosphaerae TaxID=3126357 RepID=A0ABU9PTA0_9BURK
MGKASTLFNGSGEQTLYKRVTPTLAQRDFLQEQWNALADHLSAKLSSDYDYPISTWIQGSYKFGTLIRPVHSGEEYDVDVGVYFEWAEDGHATPAPAQLREWVQRELVAYKASCSDIKRIDEPAKERCSRAVYTKQFHIDTPVYHLDRSKNRRRLACLSGKWEESDPKAIYTWFRDSVDAGGRDQLRRLVRYLKGWAAVAFEDAPESRPSSILLTVLTTEAFKAEWFRRFIGMDDDDALIAIIKVIHDRLFNNSSVLNPVDARENINRIPADKWDGLLTRLQALRDAAEYAENAPDEAAAALAWSEPFSFLMPLPAAHEVEVIDEGSGRAIMQIPEIEIEVFSRNPKQSVGRHRNEVTSVAKGRDLTFTIVNSHIIPAYATVEWTVRNDGEESDAIGDLGHRRIGIRALSVNEKTCYAGIQYMDCIIRLNGAVYAMRRVPVNIKDIRYPPRNPPKPTYTKIKSFLRKRR